MVALAILIDLLVLLLETTAVSGRPASPTPLLHPNDAQISTILEGKRVIDDIPVESLLFEHQVESTTRRSRKALKKTDSAPFIAFMSRITLDRVGIPTPKVAPEVPQ